VARPRARAGVSRGSPFSTKVTVVAEFLTLRKAAEELGVHYMTAYRYVRTGRLPAEQHSGEWRVARTDVEEMRTRSTPGAGRPSQPARAATRARLEARLLAADEPGAWAVVESALAAGASPVDVHLDLLGPALVDVGDQWAYGALTIADEHRASAVAARIIGRLGPQFVRRGRRRGTILVGMVEGEHHLLPGAMLVDLLRAAGFVAVDLGASTPPATFVDAVRATPHLLAVGVGAQLTVRLPEVAATVACLRDAGVEVPILVGGRGVPTAADALATGADGWTGSDGATAVAAFEAALTTGAHAR
jgi:MerR family transcriptional regulator, light-induced transcriptional regulator